jgi:hypothetical protein
LPPLVRILKAFHLSGSVLGAIVNVARSVANTEDEDGAMDAISIAIRFSQSAIFEGFLYLIDNQLSFVGDQVSALDQKNEAEEQQTVYSSGHSVSFEPFYCHSMYSRSKISSEITAVSGTISATNSPMSCGIGLSHCLTQSNRMPTRLQR